MPFNLFSRSSHQPEPMRSRIHIPRAALATSPQRRAESINPGSGPIVLDASRLLPFQTIANASAPSAVPGTPPPVPPRLHPPFVTIVKKFPNYLGNWEPDPADEAWDEEDMRYFDARFEWEERQIAGEDAGDPPEPPAKWSGPVPATPK